MENLKKRIVLFLLRSLGMHTIHDFFIEAHNIAHKNEENWVRVSVEFKGYIDDPEITFESYINNYKISVGKTMSESLIDLENQTKQPKKTNNGNNIII